MRRLAPPGPVVRSGPGSSSGGPRSGGPRSGSAPRPGGSGAARRTPGSDVDLSSLSFPSAPPSGSKSTPKMPQVSATGVAPKPQSAEKPAAAAKPEKAAGKARRGAGVGTALRGLFDKQVAGLPLGFWIVVAVEIGRAHV